MSIYLTFITEQHPTAEQDSRNGYHRLNENGTKYCGFLLNGKKHGMGSFLWPDGNQYHGKFENDQLSGKGRYIFADGSWYDGTFVAGCPRGFGYLVEPNRKRWLLYYEGGRSFADGAVPTQKTEEPSEPARTSLSPALGLSSAPPEIPVEKNDATYYQHCKEVRGRLVFANPILSDVPLWNAAQVRGNIVVMLRGPKRSMDDKIPPITLLDKIINAQQAGAIGVIMVDNQGKTDGWMVARCIPKGGDTIRIPGVFTLSPTILKLQEGAVHTLRFPAERPAGMPAGWLNAEILVAPEDSEDPRDFSFA